MYVSYGKKQFSLEKFYETRKGVICKPSFGLWASREDAAFGWKLWCELEGCDWCSEDNKFVFNLSEGARIFEVHHENDILPYLIKTDAITWADHKTAPGDGIDFEKMMADGYDGLELFWSEDWEYFSDGLFNFWNVDSIVIWNPNVIEAA